MELEPEVVLNAVEAGDMDILDILFASKVLNSSLDAGYTAAVLIDAGVPKSKLKILRGGGIALVKNYKDRFVTGTEE